MTLELSKASRSYIKGLTAKPRPPRPGQVPDEPQQIIPIKVEGRKLEKFVWKLEEPKTLYELREDLYGLKEELEDEGVLDKFSWQFILKYDQAGYRSSKIQNVEDVYHNFVLDNLDYDSVPVGMNNLEEGYFDDDIVEITLVKWPKNRFALNTAPTNS